MAAVRKTQPENFRLTTNLVVEDKAAMTPTTNPG
jgi:hypothetical protein